MFINLFSDLQIEEIIKEVEDTYDFMKITKSKKQNFILKLKGRLRQTGVIEDVCHKCLGSGKNSKELK